MLNGATQSDVSGDRRWAAVKNDSETVLIEARTTPHEASVWRQIAWSGDDGEAVSGHPNRRLLSRGRSAVLRPRASLGGDSRSLEVWVLWARLAIRTSGRLPDGAARFPPYQAGDVNMLGAIQYEGLSGNTYPGGHHVRNMFARGKMVAIAQLFPEGVGAVVGAGWSIRRERHTRQWANGVEGGQTTTGFSDDTSRAEYLRLQPDAEDRIYDTDGPDTAPSSVSYEIYHDFRQWVEWRGERCSTNVHWYFHAAWHRNPEQSRQIVLNVVRAGRQVLPTTPRFPASR